LELLEIDRSSRGVACQDDSVGPRSEGIFFDRQFNGVRRKALGVFDVRIGKDTHIGSQAVSFAQKLRSLSLEDALIGGCDSRKHVDANEVAPRNRSNRKSAQGVVSENIDAEWDSNGLPHCCSNHRKTRNGFRAHFFREKRRISKILENETFKTCLRKYPCLFHSPSAGLRHCHGRRKSMCPRGARECRKVNDADESWKFRHDFF